MLLATLFVLDYFYFYRMLLAVVRHGEGVEANSKPSSPIAFNLTGCISDCISRKRSSAVLLVFYGIPFVSGLIFLLYLALLQQ